jgi:hypothetical protein
MKRREFLSIPAAALGGTVHAGGRAVPLAGAKRTEELGRSCCRDRVSEGLRFHSAC